MAPALSKLIKNPIFYFGLTGITSAALIVSYGFGLLNNVKRKKLPSSSEYQIEYRISEKEKTNKTKIRIDGEFFKQIRKMLPILIPNFWSKESGLIFLITMALIVKSTSEIWLLRMTTLIETMVVSNNRPKFLQNITKFSAILPLLATITSILKWSMGELQLRFRTNLTRYTFEQYLNGFTYYKMSNLDNRLTNPDQLLTNDVDKFCLSTIDLYTNIVKPIIDIFLYIPMATMSLGLEPAGLFLIYFTICGATLVRIRRPLGGLTFNEQKLEGEYRYINSRLITNSEEVAFYYGNKREKITVMTSYGKLLNHLRKFLEFRISMGLVDNLIAKYFATVVGIYAVSMPFFKSGFTRNQYDRSMMFYNSGRILIKIAETVGRLVMAGREMSRLAGFTARMKDLLNVLSELNKGKYQRTMIQQNIEDITSSDLKSNGASSETLLKPNKGKILFQDNIIRFNNVPLVTPNGDILVRKLTFEVRSGMNVLVCGPNGCGKSSLFRTLGELWPCWGGELTKPPRGKLFYVPQKPYMTLGSLRDQIIYPHTYQDMLQHGKTDKHLIEYLKVVQLFYLETSRSNGLSSIEDWIDVLSGGEKQRIAMARLFYHNPQFAILDECTSAVSVDVEGSMYKYCKDANITLFTVSHRKSLWQYHEYYLQFDGRGGYKFGLIDNTIEEFGS